MPSALSLAGFTLLVAALLFGGGTATYLLGDLFLQLMSVALIVAGLARLQWQKQPLSADRRHLLWLAAALALVMLLQLLPLPAAVWGALPGRADLLLGHQQLGLEHGSWLAWSTDPGASLAALRALLPFWALLVLGVQLDDSSRRRLLWVVLLVALISVPLGLAQIVQGPKSDLRPYVPTNVHDAVGLYANRNHYAALLYVGLVLAIGQFLVLDRRLAGRGATRLAHASGWLVLLTILLLGLLLSRSRAGVGLALLGVLGGVAIGFMINRRIRKRWLLLGTASVLLVAAVAGFETFSGRLEQDWLDDNRWQVSRTALKLAADYGWLGSGAGTFPAAYAAFEPVDLVGDKIINHAHNDWFEWLSDLGALPLLLLLCLSLHWFYRRFAAIAQTGWTSVSPLLPISALGLMLLAVHCFVDYPLRPTANMAVLAVLWLQWLSDRSPAASIESGRTRHRSAARLPAHAKLSHRDDSPRDSSAAGRAAIRR